MRRGVIIGILLCAFSVTACKSSAVQTDTHVTASGSNSSDKKMVITQQQLIEKAKAGDSDAQFNLGTMYLDGVELKQDAQKGIEWLKKSAEQGNVRAQFNLGITYYQAVSGVTQDFALAKQWFEKAAAQNNDRAQYNLGIMYYKGDGVKKDFKKAMQLFTQAAQQGFSDAAFNLGVMYAKGEGELSNRIESYAWFSIAKEHGDQKAGDVLKQLTDSFTLKQRRAADLRFQQVQATIKVSPANQD